MGVDCTLLLYGGRPMELDALSAAYANVVEGRLGTTTLAIRHATDVRRFSSGTTPPLHAVATYEKVGRYVVDERPECHRIRRVERPSLDAAGRSLATHLFEPSGVAGDRPNLCTLGRKGEHGSAPDPRSPANHNCGFR